MASLILPIIHSAQTVFAAYNLYLARASVNKLQKYEETSQKLAKYSNSVDSQVKKTQATQASGALAILFSLLSSLLLLFLGSKIVNGIVAGVNFIVLGAAREHVGTVWKRKMKLPIPGLGEHNDAVGMTQEVRLNSAYLMASWVAIGVLVLVLL